jgi:uncharacterized protein
MRQSRLEARAPMAPADDQSSGSVTVCVRWKVKSGKEREFQDWLSGVGRAAAQFPGHQGLTVLRPSGPGSAEYVYIFRFDTYPHLRRWEESAERQDWVARARELTDGQSRKQVVTGLEYWFALPELPAGPPPTRAKMAIVTLLAIYPLSLALPALLAPVLTPVPALLRSLIISVLLILLMTYVVMPRVTRFFARWLYPRAG